MVLAMRSERAQVGFYGLPLALRGYIIEAEMLPGVDTNQIASIHFDKRQASARGNISGNVSKSKPAAFTWCSLVDVS